MLKQPPKLTYNGLTIVLSNPSRFDTFKLLSAGGGRIFDECIRPEFNRNQCDIRVKEDNSPLLPNTKAILLFGEAALKQWLKVNDSIGAMRGSLFYYDGAFTKQDCHIPTIASFFPQDAADKANHEKEFNPQDNSIETEESEYDDEDVKSRHGKTKRKNYYFWLQQDFKKVKYLLRYGQPPPPLFKPEYILYPKSDDIIQLLKNTKDSKIFVDLETMYPATDFKCIGIGFNGSNRIYIVPIVNYNYTYCYNNIHNIFAALGIAFKNNTLIAHNGAAFDFLLFPYRYHIPIGRKLEDTMIMSHRCFPDIEKSLGHCTSLWTWEPFHKDEGNVGYNNSEQVKQTMQYCGKDIYTMMLIYDSITKYAKKIPGLTTSIEQANAAIYPYLITMLQGMRYDEEKRQRIIKENDLLMTQYLRLLKILIGEKTLQFIAGKSKAPMPSSNKQCIEYFHNLLGYAVVQKGKETTKGVRNPSLGKKALYKLRLKYENPVIDICLAYREIQKESSMLMFTPYSLI